MSIKLYVEKSVEDLILKDMFKHIGLHDSLCNLDWYLVLNTFVETRNYFPVSLFAYEY